VKPRHHEDRGDTRLIVAQAHSFRALVSATQISSKIRHYCCRACCRLYDAYPPHLGFQGESRRVVVKFRLITWPKQPNRLRDQIYLSFDLLGGLPPAVASSVAEKIILGLILILKNHREVISSQAEWNTVLALFPRRVSNPEAAHVSFDFIQRLTAEGPEQCISANNVVGLVAMLDDFCRYRWDHGPSRASACWAPAFSS
jgi:hypothetical protein